MKNSILHHRRLIEKERYVPLFSILSNSLHKKKHTASDWQDSCDQDMFSILLTSNKTYLTTTRLTTFRIQTSREDL